MSSNMISKVEKARTYAGEKDRVSIGSFSATFRGNHDSYQVRYDEGAWQCSCPSFGSRNLCSHTMALERMLEGMLARDEKVEAS